MPLLLLVVAAGKLRYQDMCTDMHKGARVDMGRHAYLQVHAQVIRTAMYISYAFFCVRCVHMSTHMSAFELLLINAEPCLCPRRVSPEWFEFRH